MKSTSAHAKSVAIVSVWSIWILFILNYLAMKFNIYYTLSWFDTMMHFFGGVVSALVLYTIIVRFKISAPNRHTLFFMMIVGGVVLVGLGWEVFEYVVNYYIPTYTFDPVDTSVDIVADTAGAVVATMLIFNHKKKHHHGH